MRLKRTAGWGFVLAALVMMMTIPAQSDDARLGGLQMTLSVAGLDTVSTYEPVVRREELKNISIVHCSDISLPITPKELRHAILPGQLWRGRSFWRFP